ncbi:MAG TPA: virulence protein RhuM/Fic/DOC family protein [Burkholderiales bacterium]|nr:virulence protein RhuM/Fic/DOC family protein [Burkholderiales bacterium]
MNNKELVLFTSTDGNVTVDVQLKNDTVWLTQKQISELFDKERSVVTKHINNVFKEQELDEKSNVQNLHIANSDKPVSVYSLDVIISVGYRVKSKLGVEFRKWANSVLKDYLLKGYALNNNLLDKTHHEYQNLLDLLGKTLANNQLITPQGQSIINLINDYATTWTSLLQYDEDRLLIPNNMHQSSIALAHENALAAINEFKSSLLAIGEATELFGNERNDQLQSILSNLDQTMFGEELYRSVEEKAANLFYMVIKDHPFSDGNKRIGSFLFLLYIQLNKLPLKIDNIGLTALALLIAESDPQQKDLLTRLIINLLVPN